MTGQLTPPTLAAATHNPSFLASARVGTRHVLYAVNEGDAHTSAIASFLIDPATAALTPLNKVPSGTGPCFVSVDGTASSVFCANYMGSSIDSFRINPDGTLSQAVEHLDFHEKQFGHQGPNKVRQDAPHPHSATISPDNRFLIVNDLGNDKIVTFFIHPETARLGPPQLNECRDPGSGPRHVAFHPNQRWVYGINEIACTIQQYLWNTTHAAGGSQPVALLTEAGQAISTLDPAFHGTNTAAEIVVSPDGNYLIASNRGENSLVVFHIDPIRGTPSVVQRIACGGKTPRQFTLDPSGKWLLCGNSESATVTVFARDESSGRLTGPVQTLPIDNPQMVLFA